METTRSGARGDLAVRARGLARRFGRKQALSGFELTVRRGSITGLLGPNGSGKSTLMRCLVGLVRPDAGEAEVAGVPLRGDGTAVRRVCTYAPGEAALYGELTGLRHLAWFLRGRERNALRRARALAERLGLPLRRRVRGYSHGMKRQLLFCASLAPDVPVRILDEPTEGLDPEKRGEVLDILAEDARAGRTILLSSHHLGEVDRACDRLVFLSEGRKVAEEDASEIAARARRSVRLEFADERALGAARVALAAHPELRFRVADTAIWLELERDDPREPLARLFAEPDLPRPVRIDYGRLSLADLYREIYGVKAC